MPESEILIYINREGDVKVDVRLEEDTVWLTQDQMATLFGKAKSTINEHIQNIYIENELDESNSMRKFGNSEFSTKPTNFYNLDVIISVGYRVKSQQGTHFRIWATQRLNEYIIKALLGMQSYDRRHTVSIKKSDVSIAKNYLNEEEMRLLGLLVEQYLAFAETMAQQHIPMYMDDWIMRLDSILQMNGREILTHAGKISHQEALEKSKTEFEKYRQKQRIIEKEQNLIEIEQDIKKLNLHN